MTSWGSGVGGIRLGLFGVVACDDGTAVGVGPQPISIRINRIRYLFIIPVT